MKKQQRLSVLLALGLAVACSPAANAGRVVSTFDPGGADAEVREASPTSRRGTNQDGTGTEHFELGVRENSTHNGHVLMKFGVSSVSPAELLKPIIVRTHWSLNNLGNNRIEDLHDQQNSLYSNTPNVAFDYYVLDPTNAGADWNEDLIAYQTSAPTTVIDPDTGDPIPGGANPAGTVAAPGVVFDGNFGTDDIQTGLGNYTLLGTNYLRSLNRNATQPIENRIPIGEAFEITFAPGSPLHLAIAAAQLTGHQTLTVLTTLQHDFDDVVTPVPVTDPFPIGVPASWNNHNYVFMPKEKGVVGVGPAPNFPDKDGYDNDVTDTIDWDPVASGVNPPHSPWQGQLNTQSNPFAPQLEFVPEPGSMMLAGLSGLALLMRRRMA
jgi:hypothetical protein